MKIWNVYVNRQLVVTMMSKHKNSSVNLIFRHNAVIVDSISRFSNVIKHFFQINSSLLSFGCGMNVAPFLVAFMRLNIKILIRIDTHFVAKQWFSSFCCGVNVGMALWWVSLPTLNSTPNEPQNIFKKNSSSKVLILCMSILEWNKFCFSHPVWYWVSQKIMNNGECGVYIWIYCNFPCNFPSLDQQLCNFRWFRVENDVIKKILRIKAPPLLMISTFKARDTFVSIMGLNIMKNATNSSYFR